MKIISIFLKLIKRKKMNREIEYSKGYYRTQCELLRKQNEQLNAQISKLDLKNKSYLLEIGHLKTIGEFHLEDNKNLIAKNQELQQTILKLQNDKNFEIQKLEKQILAMKKRTNKDVFEDTLANNKRLKYDSDTLIESITSINYII